MSADVCMVYDENGNAFDYFDYTPEALEAKARELRALNGELTTVTMEPSPFATLAAAVPAVGSAEHNPAGRGHGDQA